MRGDARRFRLGASRLLYETEKAPFAPSALRSVRNVFFVEEARHSEISEFSKKYSFVPRVACTCGGFAGGEKTEKVRKSEIAPFSSECDK